MPIAQNLKYLMDYFGVSKYRLSKIMGVSQTSVANWISGETEPYKKTQAILADLFGVTIDELNGDELPHIKGENRCPIKKSLGKTAVELIGEAAIQAGSAIAAVDTAGVALVSNKTKKKKPALDESELDSELIKRLCRLSPQELALVDVFVQGLLAKREVLSSPDD